MSLSRTFSHVTLDSLRATIGRFAEERDWDQFHQPRNLLLALVGEVGELAEIFQWKGETECGLPGWSDREREHLGEELSDVLLYLVRLADRCGIDLAAAAERKMGLNRQKYPADLARGSSAKYTAYEGVVSAEAEAETTENMSESGNGNGNGNGRAPMTPSRGPGAASTGTITSSPTNPRAGVVHLHPVTPRGSGSEWPVTAVIAVAALSGSLILALATWRRIV